MTTNTFSGLIPSATITIPEGSRDAYLADPNWKRLLDMASGEISGTFGDNQNLTWTLTFADSTLTISGTGEMGYIYYNWPWEGFENYIAKVIMEEGVTNIANGAFYSHSNLREVTIPSSVTSIESDAFNETALYYNESNWADGALYIDNCLIATSEWQMGETGHFTIADGTRLIADEAFSYRSWLTGVTLPNSVTKQPILSAVSFHLPPSPFPKEAEMLIWLTRTGNACLTWHPVKSAELLVTIRTSHGH